MTSQSPPSDPSALAPAWRREPYRVLFPLGVLLAWAGVGHWLALAAFGVGGGSAVFHSIAQIQGFLMAFVFGFLFTAIPRRTGTAPPAAWEMTVACLAPVGTTLAAAFEQLALSQTFWGGGLLVLVAFAVRRLLSQGARRRPPNSFVWVPLSLGIGAGGAIAIGAQRGLGQEWFWLHDLGRNLVLQGMILGLIVGVGGMVIPLLTCGDPPPDGADDAGGRLRRAGHVLAAVALLATFVVETLVSQRWGHGLRSVLLLGLLLVVARIGRRPSIPGSHRKLVWAAAWCLPLGYLGAGLDPPHAMAWLHVVFMGGFALLALSVGVHVSLAHGGYQRMARGRSWQVAALGGLMGLALAARLGMAYAPTRVWTLMGLAAGAFLIASCAWFHLLLPRLWKPAPPAEALAQDPQP